MTKILIVEDDLHTRKILEMVSRRDRALRHHALEVLGAEDGEEGLRVFQERRPDVVITDLLMPKVDGFEFVRRLRADPAGKHVPVLVTSAVVRDHSTLRKLERDYNVEIQLKPFSPRVMAERIRQLLSRLDRERQPGDPGVPRAAATESASAGQGTLDPGGIVKLLFGLHREQQSGVLELRRGKVRKKVFLLAGHPVFVQSNIRAETLGQLMVRRKRLTGEQHEQTLQLARAEKIKYGEALVRQGLMSEQQVMEELVAQTRHKLQACLRWPEGSWSFAADTSLGGAVPRCTVDPIEAMFSALKNNRDTERALARLIEGDAEEKVVPTAELDRLREAFADTFGSAVVEAVAAGASIADLLRVGGTMQDVAIQLDALLLAGMVQIKVATASTPEQRVDVTARALALDSLITPAVGQTGAAGAPRGAVRLRRGAPLSRPPLATKEVNIARQLIESTYLGLHGKNHYEVLGVIRETDPAGIEVAYRIKRKQFDLERFRGLDLGASYEHLEEICDALDQAFHVLSDTNRRAAYDAKLPAAKVPVRRGGALDAEQLFHEGREALDAERFAEAVSAFSRAIELDEQPEYRAYEALAHYFAAGCSAKAGMEAMVRVQAALAHDPEQPSAHLVAARIARHRGAAEEAREHLREAIKVDPAAREAFDLLQEMLLAAGEVEELEEEYRRAIFHLGTRHRERAAELWRDLVSLYSERLEDREKARMACEAAIRLNPEDRELRALLARLDAATPERWPQAVLGCRALLRMDPADPAPLHELYKLHRSQGRDTAAYFVACAAMIRGVADEDQLRLVGELGRPELPRIEQPLDSQAWAMLQHPLDDEHLTGLFHALTPVLERLFPLVPADLGIDLERPADLPSEIDEQLTYTSALLGLSPPVVALSAELGADVQGAGSAPPVLLLGDRAARLEDQRELVFRLGRALTLLGPGRQIGAWRPHELLRDFLVAAVGIVLPRVEAPEISERARAIQRELRGEQEICERCAHHVDGLAERADYLDLAEWQLGIQRTAERVGFLLCDDLLIADRVLADLDTEAEVELIDFAVSETYGELRGHLGLGNP